MTGAGRGLPGHLTDDTLMKRVQEQDDLQALAELYDRHAARAFSAARDICSETSRAEDVVREGFMSVWRTRADYRRERGSFKDWVMRVVKEGATESERKQAYLQGSSLRARPHTRTPHRSVASGVEHMYD